MSNFDPVRVGFIGCGGAGGSHVHSSSRPPLAELFEHRWYMDLSEERLEHLCEEVTAGRPTTRLEDVLGDTETEAVVISTYHDTHVPLAVQAAEAGKHIFVEKPLSLTSAEGLRAKEAVEKHGVKLMVGFCFVHSPLVAQVKEVIPRPTASVIHGLMGMRARDDSWSLDPVRGGGTVFANTCHNIALMCRLHDARPVWVAACGGEFLHKTGIPDSVTAVVSFEDGSSSSFVAIEVGAKGPPKPQPHFGKWVAQVVGSGVEATICERFQSLYFVGNTDAQDVHIENYGEAKGMWAELDAWARWIREDIPPVGGTVEDGILTTLIWEKMCDSIRTGKVQKITNLGGPA